MRSVSRAIFPFFFSATDGHILMKIERYISFEYLVTLLFFSTGSSKGWQFAFSIDCEMYGTINY